MGSKGNFGQQGEPGNNGEKVRRAFLKPEQNKFSFNAQAEHMIIQEEENVEGTTHEESNLSSPKEDPSQY